jgi:hypothetical protein
MTIIIDLVIIQSFINLSHVTLNLFQGLTGRIDEMLKRVQHDGILVIHS